MPGLVRVFIACSLDGFIAGPGDDLSWLPQPAELGGDVTGYDSFMRGVGALLLGRRTYTVVRGFGGAWPYGDRPTLIATHRPLQDAPPTARAVSGEIAELVAGALAAAGGRDVYLDGGDLIRQALDAGLIDDLTVTLVPAVLGSGFPLFAGATRRHFLRTESTRQLPGGLVQLRLIPAAMAGDSSPSL